MNIYTRRGDGGETGLVGGDRVPKSHVRVEAYGVVDELSATLGMAAVAVNDSDVRHQLTLVQEDLFAMGASLAAPGSADESRGPSLPPLPLYRIEEMERWIDLSTAETPPLKSFILPGGTRAAAVFHVARTVCRRAERRLVELHRDAPVSYDALRYLNRLSDLLFVMARVENRRADEPDIEWQPR